MPAAEPPVTFSTFIVSLASSALAHLGRAEAMAIGGVNVAEDRALAVQTLDVLDLLAAKTKGNLDPEEARLLDALCSELRSAISG